MKNGFFHTIIDRIFPYYENRPAPLLWGVTRPPETSPGLRYTVLGWLEFIRIQRPITSLFGPQYTRSRQFIEIDLTYACNLKCPNCNRSCSQAPSREYIPVNQIQDFVDDSIEKGIYWERIRLLGGEPTLHPYFLDVITILRDYKEKFSPDTKIQVATNGHGPYVRSMLSKLPGSIDIINTEKTDSPPVFYSFNAAPIDQRRYSFADFTNACWIAKVCGMGLTPRGYYPCAIAGGIDRVFGFNRGKAELPDASDDMLPDFNIFCRYCGHFKRLVEPEIDKPVLSETWKSAYETYKKK